ncbi:MAG: 4-hydroxythreonine-4-phosphate dehydrogenase PdxA [Candidatus Magnetobacterium sp. LHC-1]|uniref:4-hydroxythreonine-4-phosphate dehydrogenase PdxA n=1 Tax=Candidatus Magnetobacterium casense TaxID=1455061 RepID=A0ABS6RUT3_9BACT|nr:4-hydroxythreonine-4-phosphate dehydrogenase PdxA [Candidatus Magnetobacterium casensis]MBF0607204.1 4-hydroxythreonine-4-phosphate dehydrogenase PdxA [Nitrospirota bacterium]MBV6340399.1 4-hydroxythreonine-4-phosphate dehydrogenase PdxA [Candidatus Magnetobacterium casensis]
MTLGDPGGVGPEVALKAYTQLADRQLVFVGDTGIVRKALELIGLKRNINDISSTNEADFRADVVNVLSTNTLEANVVSAPTAQGGRASAACIKRAVDMILSGDAHALVTAPISKEALKLAGVDFSGHTELLAHLTSTTEYAMMLCGGPLRVILVTIHVPLKDVPTLITTQRVLKTIRLASKAARMFGLPAPRIAVAGVNPHAGEAGILGSEEDRDILPAIRQAQAEGIPVTGPYPPDTVFHRAYKGELDIIVCMYHDQGLIPLKMIAFDTGVNITIGLPFVRTSPDHGTAFDIAWKGIAGCNSMVEAITMAFELDV